jgi:hypothetical protein
MAIVGVVRIDDPETALGEVCRQLSVECVFPAICSTTDFSFSNELPESIIHIERNAHWLEFAPDSEPNGC